MPITVAPAPTAIEEISPPPDAIMARAKNAPKIAGITSSISVLKSRNENQKSRSISSSATEEVMRVSDLMILEL